MLFFSLCFDKKKMCVLILMLKIIKKMIISNIKNKGNMNFKHKSLLNVSFLRKNISMAFEKK